MELLSRFKKKQNSTTTEGSDEFRTQAERESDILNASPKGKSSTKRQTSDPLLPEKKRARRRFIGALAIGLGAIVFLPMIFDSEPKFSVRDSEVVIPSRDKSIEDKTSHLATQPNDIVVEKNSSPTSMPVTNDTREVIVQPSQLGIQDSKKNQEPRSDVTQESKTLSARETVISNQPNPTNVNKSIKDTSIEKSNPSPGIESSNTKKESITTKTRTKDEETARAVAILEGKIAPDANGNHVTKQISKKITLQVAALATQEKVDELRQKLKVSGIESSTSKVSTPKGEVIRVRVGPYSSKEDADKVINKLKQLGLNATLVSN